MDGYFCARCGSDEVHIVDPENEGIDDSDDDREVGWCDDCGDYRPLEYLEFDL